MGSIANLILIHGLFLDIDWDLVNGHYPVHLYFYRRYSVSIKYMPEKNHYNTNIQLNMDVLGRCIFVHSLVVCVSESKPGQ